LADLEVENNNLKNERHKDKKYIENAALDML